MPSLCTICAHPARREIEKLLVSATPLRKISARFETTVSALHRHRAGHLLIEAVKREQEAKSAARVDDVLGHARTLQDRTENLFGEAQTIYQEARRAKDQKTALAAIRESALATREVRGNVELVARLTGQLDPPSGARIENMIIVLPRADALGIQAPATELLDVTVEKP